MIDNSNVFGLTARFLRETVKADLIKKPTGRIQLISDSENKRCSSLIGRFEQGYTVQVQAQAQFFFDN
jgi:hypothetical protein